MKTVEVRSMLSFTTARIETWFNDHHISNGTGFYYKAKHGYLLVTNRHILTGRDNITGECLDKKNAAIPNKLVIKSHLLRVKREQQSEQLQFGIEAGGGFARVEVGYKGDQPAWVESHTWGVRCDVGMVPYRPPKGYDVLAVNELPLETPIYLYPADHVSVLGYPFGAVVEENYPLWVNGTIACEPEIDVDDLPMFYIDCRTRPGSSGSPVFAFRPPGIVPIGPNAAAAYANPIHKFLGVYSGRINAESDIGMVWKRRILDEVADHTVVDTSVEGNSRTIRD